MPSILPQTVLTALYELANFTISIENVTTANTSNSKVSERSKSTKKPHSKVREVNVYQKAPVSCPRLC
jgi:hypothetical protein